MFKEINILKVFFENPTKEFGVRELARIVNLAPATASKELKRFSKNKLLKKRKERRTNLYSANIEEDAYRDIKVYYNVRKIRDSGLIDKLNEFYLKPSVVMFGSAAHGMDTETSDFDILIISERKNDFPELEKFERKLNRKIQIFRVAKIKDLKNEHLINSVLNGIILQGEIKWI